VRGNLYCCDGDGFNKERGAVEKIKLSQPQEGCQHHMIRMACVFSKFVWIGVVYQKIQFNSLVLDL